MKGVCKIRSSDSQRSKRGRVERPCHTEIVVVLITGKRGLCLVAKSSIDLAVIVTKLRELRLNRAHGRVIRGLIRNSIGRIIVVVTLVVIVRIGRSEERRVGK